MGYMSQEYRIQLEQQLVLELQEWASQVLELPALELQEWESQVLELQEWELQHQLVQWLVQKLGKTALAVSLPSPSPILR